MSESSREILQAFNDPDISLERLCRILETDPSITARLLGLANSAYFGCRQTVHSVRQAVIQVLGLNLAKSLALSILISDVLDTRQCSNFSGQRYWFTAVTTAILAKKFCTLAQTLHSIVPPLAYTAGLLHNIGLLALVHKCPEIMSKTFEESLKTARPIGEILRGDHGVDQFESGGWLADRWQFPEPIQVAIREHGNPRYTGRFNALATLIGITSRLSDELYRGNSITQAFKDCSIDLGISTTDAEKIHDEMQGEIEDLRLLAELLDGKQR